MTMYKSFAVVSIATKGYTEYWKSMAQSLFDSISVPFVLHVATDDLTIADQLIGKIESQNSIVVHEIPSYGWPEATLLRYAILEEIIEEINEKFTFYIDADMLIHQDFFRKIDLIEQEVVLVAHPGYYRSSGKNLIKLYLKKPKLIISDVASKLLLGGIGAWEKRPESSAYVIRSRRDRYVCGGFWGGGTTRILNLVKQLKIAVEDDLEKGVMAKWHDESHLNSWASKNDFRLEDPSYCHDSTYENLKDLEKVITAVRKQSKVSK